MSINRQRLSADVHSELLGQIIRGEFQQGQRLRDSELAQKLGVSRTPVREALLRLEREGFITAQKHLGFSVKLLHEDEIRDIYPLVALLECHALRLCRVPAEAKLATLRDLTAKLREEPGNPIARIDLDSAWHRSLVEEAGNEHLLRILADLKRIVFRYEYSFMQVPEFVAASTTEHEAILEALAEGDRRKAAKLLDEHWRRCTESTLEVFKSLDPARAKADGALA